MFDSVLLRGLEKIRVFCEFIPPFFHSEINVILLCLNYLSGFTMTLFITYSFIVQYNEASFLFWLRLRSGCSQWRTQKVCFNCIVSKSLFLIVGEQQTTFRISKIYCGSQFFHSSLKFCGKTFSIPIHIHWQRIKKKFWNERSPFPIPYYYFE
jgi:hypothetical protein